MKPDIRPAASEHDAPAVHTPELRALALLARAAPLPPLRSLDSGADHIHAGFVADQRIASPVPSSSSAPAPVAW